MGTTCRAWMMAALLAASSAGVAQAPDRPPLPLDRSDYFEAPGVNRLVFSNVNEGLFADAKISGGELIQQGVRTATNGDVRLSATPGRWDPSATFIRRRVDKTAGVIERNDRVGDDRRALRPRLLRLDLGGVFAPVAAGATREWGNYLRYRYVRFDFSDVTTPGTYPIEYGTIRSAPFPIGTDALAGLWHLANDVCLPIAMDHVTVNEAYRVWLASLPLSTSSTRSSRRSS